MNEKFYKPLKVRTPDHQYQERLTQIIQKGIWAGDLPQGTAALTCFGTLPQMVFDLSNGVPFITERSVNGFWRKAIAEIIAFINGARTLDEIASYGCDFWEDYRNKDVGLPLAPGDLGPGSYGPAFHDFPMPNGETLNQFKQLVEQIRDYPNVRSHRIMPWIPFYTARGPKRMVNVAPCHGWLHFRIIEGRLHMRMDQYSADMPIGVPSNMIQYAALLLMVCQTTGYPPGNYVHSFSDAHIYQNQIDAMKGLLVRKALPFPALHLDPMVKDLFDFRIEHFELEEYHPHPAMKIPYSP